MTTTPKPEQRQFIVDEQRREKLRRIAREVNARLDIPEEPTITAAELRARMRANGIRPEDNILSRELLRMRYGDNYDQDEYMRQLNETQEKKQHGYVINKGRQINLQN